MIKTFPKRLFFFAGTFLITLLLYIDRICISSAQGQISESLYLNEKQMGWIMACFALGYALFQVPGGALADKYGPRKVLTLIIALWSLFTALTGAAWNYLSMLIFRFIFGACEAGAFPSISRASFSWVPLKERGLFQGINFSGSRLGAAIALPFISLVIQWLGWRETFIVLGISGILFALAWYLLFRDKPEEHHGIKEVEKMYIIANRQQNSNKEEAERISTSEVLKSGNVWLLMGQYVSSNFIFFFCLTWLLPYVKNRYDLDLVQAGVYSSFPLLAGAIGNLVSGAIVDYIYRKLKWKLSRRLPAIIGFSLVIIGLLASLEMETVLPAILFLSLAIFGADMTLSPSWTACIDIGKEHSGKVSGVMNMAGNLGSFITSLAFPYLLSWTGSHYPFFYITMVLASAAIIMWLFIDPEKNILSDKTRL